MNELMKLACSCFWVIINSSSSSRTKDSNNLKNKGDDKKHKFEMTVLREQET